MQNNILASLTRLSDSELVARVMSLAARERDATAQLVAHLAELDTRDVHLREGYTSLFVYCRDCVGLSEAEAYTRIMVARAARRFPVILDLLAAGAVSLTAARLLAPYLTADNHAAVLESARGKSKEEIEKIRARLAPQPDVPPSVRKLPTPRLEPAGRAEPPPAAALPIPPTAAADTKAAAASSPAASMTPPTALPPARPAPMTPLSPDRYRLQLTIDGEVLEKLRLAKDMLGHAIPSGDETAVLDRALTALLVDLAKKKFADTTRPRASRGTRPGARCPSAAVKRAVWLRDLGRCAFIGANGHRCNERRFIEFHHVDPYVLGGEATAEQISLRCRRHNGYEAALYFGKRRPAVDSGLVQEESPRYGWASQPHPVLVPEQVPRVSTSFAGGGTEVRLTLAPCASAVPHRAAGVRRRDDRRQASPVAPTGCARTTCEGWTGLVSALAPRLLSGRPAAMPAGRCACRAFAWSPSG